MKRNPRATLVATASLLVSLPVALFVVGPARAQEKDEEVPTLPQGDTDLYAVKSVAATARALSTRKQFLSEPQYDPARAEAAARAMADVVVALEALRPWTRQAAHTVSEARVERIEQALATGERLADVQEILAWQKFAQDVAELAWDAIGVVEALKRVDTLLGSQADEGAVNAARHAPGVDLHESWKALNELASGTNVLISRGNAQLGEAGSPVLGDLMELHGRLTEASDLLQKVIEQRSAGKPLLDRATVRPNLSALINPLFQAARLVATRARKDLESREAELQTVLAAEERQLTEWSKQRERVGRRHDMHEEVTTDLEDAWIELWRSFQVNGEEGAPMPGEPSTWGEALVAYLPELRRRTEVAGSALAALEVTAGDEARLELAQRSVAPGAELVVSYDLPPGAARRASLSLHRSRDRHGSAAENGRTRLDLRSIPRPAPGQRATGRLTFAAPSAPGPYDVRLNDGESDLELRYLPFEVRSPAEGVRMVFAAGMVGAEPGAAESVTLPPVVAGEHSERLIEVRVVDAAGQPVGGVPVEVRVLDADARETQGGPHVRGRWGLMSDEDGGVRHDHLSPLVFAVPEGRWTIELHSAEVSNRLRIHCSAVPAPRDGVGIAAEARPRAVNAGAKAEGRRTVTVRGNLVGGARGVRYRLQARLDPAVGRILSRAAAEQGWVDVPTGAQSFTLFAVVRAECRDGRHAVALRALEPESGAVVGESSVSLNVWNIPEGFGLVDVRALDPYDNLVWKPWTLHWVQDGRAAVWASENYFGSAQLVPAGQWYLRFNSYFASSKKHKSRTRRVLVLPETLNVVELRDEATAIVEFRTFDAAGRYDALGEVDLFRAGEEKPEDRHIRRFATRNQTVTPTGHVSERTWYAEVPAGTYDVRFQTARVNGQYQRTEWYRVTVGPREWRILSAPAE